jgi:hypothetical protein
VSQGIDSGNMQEGKERQDNDGDVWNKLTGSGKNNSSFSKKSSASGHPKRCF